jgi:hypothetical protein
MVLLGTGTPVDYLAAGVCSERDHAVALALEWRYARAGRRLRKQLLILAPVLSYVLINWVWIAL